MRARLVAVTAFAPCAVDFREERRAGPEAVELPGCYCYALALELQSADTLVCATSAGACGALNAGFEQEGAHGGGCVDL